MFWFGDFNFRVEDEFKNVLTSISEGKLLGILEKCQLNMLRSQNEIFSDFHEGEINFKPTYRRIRHHNNSYSNKKNQSPSFCDRIFFRSLSKDSLQLLEYSSKEDQLGR